MTMRQLGSAIVKLLGVNCAVWWVVSVGNAEAGRRPGMWQAINPMERPLLPTLLTLAVGLAVVASAGWLTRILDSRAEREAE